MSLTETTKAPTTGAAKKPATVFVDGGSGTTGLGINERLKLQNDVVVKTIADDKRKDPAAKKAELIDAYRKIIDVYIPAKNAMIDDVIDPRETRPVICRGLEMAAGKKVDRPWKRNGVVPV